MNQHETDLVKEWLSVNNANVHFFNEKKVIYPVCFIGEDSVSYKDDNAVEYVFFLSDDIDSNESTTSPDGKKRNSCSCVFLIEQDAVVGLFEYLDMVQNTSNDYKSKFCEIKSK